MKKQKINFWAWNKDAFISGIKNINERIFLIVLLDAIFYLASGYILFQWFKKFQLKISMANLPSEILSSRQAELAFLEAKSVYHYILISLAVVILAVSLLAAVHKSLIWLLAAKRKMNFKEIFMPIAISFVWILFWIALIFSVPFVFMQQSSITIMIAIFAIAFYFSNSFFPLLMQNSDFKTLLGSFKFGIANIKFLILPNIAIVIGIMIIGFLTSLVKFEYSFIISAVIILFYIAAARYYTAELTSKIRQSH